MTGKRIAKAVPGRKLGLLWASPECTHHSVARGGRPRSDQSRASAWLVLKWLSELYVERVIIENVPEFMSWGPLDNAGRPVKSLKGKTFRAFIQSHGGEYGVMITDKIERLEKANGGLKINKRHEGIW
jgi:site-specific DNA-cytosine methylase